MIYFRVSGVFVFSANIIARPAVSLLRLFFSTLEVAGRDNCQFIGVNILAGGCKDLFLDDPAGVLAEYRQRKADKRAKSDK